MEYRPPATLKFEGNLAENFRKFKQSFEIYLIASGKNEKTDEVKVATFLNLLGEEGIEIFNTLKLQENERQNYIKVMSEFEKYMNPRKNIVYERFKFFSRKQEEGEYFDHFLTELKKLATTCEFGEQRDSLIRDRIVLGISNKSLQERLLAKEDLDLDKTEKECRATEITKNQVRNMQEQGICAIEERKYRVNKKKEDIKDVQTKLVNKFLCKRCNRTHGPRECRAYGQKCKKCGRLNHFAIACRMRYVKEVQEREEAKKLDEQDLEISTLRIINEINILENKSVWFENIKVNENTIEFKIDSGSEVNILPVSIYNKYFRNMNLLKTNIVLQAYGGFKIKPIGKIDLNCMKGNNSEKITFLIVDVKSCAILGLKACEKLGVINRKEINLVQGNSKSNGINNKIENEQKQMLDKYVENFSGLGKFSKKCDIKLKLHYIPVVKPARRVPLSLKPKLKSKLDDLEKLQIISKVAKPGEWVNNLVIVEKNDGSLRLCLDPQDLNKSIQRNYYNIPTFDDITAQLSGKKYFTVLDLKDGYYQCELSENASNLCTFSSPFGCYKFKRLPFGISIAPEFFQKLIDETFGDIEGVCIYFDDVLIAAETEKEHDRILELVMQRAKLLKIKFNPKKIQFKMSNVKYLGHIFCNEGVKPDEDRVKAIKHIESPTCVKELQSILGMLNYLQRFIPNFAELTSSIRELLKKNVVFEWLPNHEKTLDRIKEILSSKPVLSNFDPNESIIIETDASQNGLGCTLLQKGKPVYYASRSLTDTEKSYAQIEKEMLGAVFATKKFHYFIYGQPVTIITDHKPLLGIMRKEMSKIASHRLQRMKLKLLRYNIKLEYRSGKTLYIADLLSRSFIKDEVKDDPELSEIVHSIEKHLSITASKRAEFTKETESDPALSKVVEFINRGWPLKYKSMPNIVKPFWSYKDDIAYVNGLLFLNDRLIVPKILIKDMLKLLHQNHMGITKTRLRAKCNLFWPSMSTDIEDEIKRCPVCEKFRNKNIKEPMIPHPIPDRPFKKIASDILEYGGKNYMTVIDYYSRWLEIIPIQNKTADAVVNKLKCIFATHGIPEEFVADNMPYNSYSFHQFAKRWGFKVITSSPRYPRSNGLAERAVGIAKNFLRKSDDIYLSLLEYRNTPVTGLNASPAQLLMNKMLQSRLPMIEGALVPNYTNDYESTRNNIETKRMLDKYYYDRTSKKRDELEKGENVTLRKGKEWVPARIEAKANTPRSYVVRDEDNNVYRRNSSFIRKSLNEPTFATRQMDEEENKEGIVVESALTHKQEDSVHVRPVENRARKRNPPVKYKDYVVY